MKGENTSPSLMIILSLAPCCESYFGLVPMMAQPMITNQVSSLKGLCQVIFGRLDNHEFKIRKWYYEILLLIKLSLHQKQDDSEQKRTLSRRYAINLKNARPTFFKITRQSCPFASNHACLSYCCISFLLFNGFK